MPRWNDVSGNLARDYINGAKNLLWAAEIICNQIEECSADWYFKAENPVIFLLGHAAELILKAGLANAKILEGNLKKSHDLVLLMNKSREQKIPLNENFCSEISRISNNFKNHDHRYSRSFAGFPDSEHERLTSRIGDKSVEGELRNYGLVVKNRPDLRRLLEVIKSQLT